MHFVSINTFLWAAPRRGIACRREEIVVRAALSPRGWSLAGALLPACLLHFQKKEAERVEEVEKGSVWSKLVPADLSSGVEKGHFLSKPLFRHHLVTSHFYRGPRGLRKKKVATSMFRGQQSLTGQAGKGKGVQSIST